MMISRHVLSDRIILTADTLTSQQFSLTHASSMNHPTECFSERMQAVISDAP